MQTKYFFLGFLAVVLGTFLAVLAALWNLRAQPVHAAYSVYSCGNFVEQITQEPVEVVVKLSTKLPTLVPTLTATKIVPVIFTPTPTREIVEAPTLVLTSTPTPTDTSTPFPTDNISTPTPTTVPTQEPTECPLNTNRAGNHNLSCFHPDDGSGQEQFTVHP